MFYLRKVKQINQIQLSGENIYLFALTVTLVVSFLANTTFVQYIAVKNFNRINYLILGILVLKIFILDNYRWYELAGIFFVLAIGVYSWRVTNNNVLMIMLTFIFAAKRVHFDKIIHQYFKVNLTLILLVSVYALLGIIRNLSYVRTDSKIMRYALGVLYPTDYAAYVFYLILAYAFINYKRIGKRQYLLFTVIAVALYAVTNARLDTILILLIIPILLVAKRAGNSTHRISRILAANYWSLTPILPYAFGLMTVYFNPANSIFWHLNDLLSGRLLYGNIAFQQHPVKLLSQKVVEHGWGGIQGLKMFKDNQARYFFIDSSFIRLLVVYGVVLSIIVIGIMVIISVRAELRQSYLLPAIILLITLSSLIDQHLLEISFNPFLLAFLANGVVVTSSCKSATERDVLSEKV